MNLKKGILLTALTATTIGILGLFNSVDATSAPTPKELNIIDQRNSGYSYTVNNNAARYIWKIYDTKNNKNETFYCIKGGPGFGSTSMESGTSAANYTQIFDMRKPSTITGKYSTAISSIINNSKNYKSLMWVLEKCYIPAKTGASSSEIQAAEESKRALLEAVDEYAAKYPRVYENTSDYYSKLSDILADAEANGDDFIDIVQQLAVWHFTNPENTDPFHVESNPSIQYSWNREGFRSFNPNDDEDLAKMHAMDALFAYLTKTPEEEGFSYDYETTGNTSSPVQMPVLNPIVETSGNRLIVGPYRIEQIRNIAYTLDSTVKDGDNRTITDVIYLDNNKREVSSSNIKNLVDTNNAGTTKNFYISIPSTTNASNINFSISGSYFDTTVTFWSVENPDPNKDQPVVQVEKGNNTIFAEINAKQKPEKEFDLALRKFITQINDESLEGVNSRVPTITNTELQNLANKRATGINNTTAEKEHKKGALTVETGDKVVYTIRVYNEGEVDGWATQVTDHLPTGLKFIPVSESSINKQYGWSNPSGDGRAIVTSYLADTNRKLTAFNKDTLALDYEDIKIECEVIAKPGNATVKLKNVAEITGNKDINGNTGDDLTDCDSTPGSLTDSQINGYGETGNYYQDDDDFELLKLLPSEEKIFDLSLRKFISNVQTAEGKSNVLARREPVVDVTPLLEGEDTAKYNHTKQPVGVSNGDIVTYTIRVYNEGQVDGYVTEITDHLPKQLEFIIDDEINIKYGWAISSDGRTVTTDITSPKTTNSANRDLIYAQRTDKTLLRSFGYEEGAKLDYIDVQIRCRVKEDIDLYEKITNIADITGFIGFVDNEEVEVTDRDSQEKNVILPTDKTLPEYKDSEIQSGKEYIPGQEDDDDFEKLVLQRFDLALRKFITGVANGEKVTEITDRVPIFNKVNDKEYTYEHTKEPVEVANGNIVIYTLRIFNEGNVSGYASKVKDDIPEGLEFLPDNIINTAFSWKMYEKDGTETDDVTKASYIETDFLSKEKETDSKDNLIDAFHPDKMTMPDYKDLKVAFKVTEPNTSDRIIINQAQISEDSDEEGKPIDDVDSRPDEWNKGEDDQDIEKIKVKYFDLSLKKWVTESIVTYNGKTTVTKSKHTGDENPEAPMKVEIQTDKINKTTVKFRFKIKVTNEGEIAGYATELIDYIPDGLKFVAKDNPKWTVSEDGKVTTDQLKDKLLEPRESATVDIVLTWINGKNNMGQKVNWAEINKDKNEYDSPDIDSTPGNNEKGEDDIDQAPVLLAPATGSMQSYLTLVMSCTAIMGTGIFLIKRFVI